MTIETKYDIEDMVWVMFSNGVIKTDVKSVIYKQYRENDHSPVTKMIRYTLGHKEILEYNESEVFKTKEELIASL